MTNQIEETLEDSATSQSNDFAENAFCVMAVRQLLQILAFQWFGGLAVRLDHVCLNLESRMPPRVQHHGEARPVKKSWKGRTTRIQSKDAREPSQQTDQPLRGHRHDGIFTVVMSSPNVKLNFQHRICHTHEKRFGNIASGESMTTQKSCYDCCATGPSIVSFRKRN